MKGTSLPKLVPVLESKRNQNDQIKKTDSSFVNLHNSMNRDELF